jgi:hypothetical protein
VFAGSGRWATRRFRAVALVAVGAAGGAAAIGVASVPDGHGSIHACYQVTTVSGTVVPVTTGPNVRIIDSDAGQACRTTVDPLGAGAAAPLERELDFNQTGPQGLQGAPGSPGPAGPAGAPGATGGSGSPSTPGPTGHIDFGPVGGHPDINVDLQEVDVSLNFGGVPSTGGAGASKPSVPTFTVLLPAVQFTAQLSKDATSGIHFSKITVTVFKPGTTAPLRTYLLTGGLITAAQTTFLNAAATSTATLTVAAQKVVEETGGRNITLVNVKVKTSKTT